MASEAIYTIRDHSDERSTVKFSIADLDETSWVATTAALAVLRTAMEALTLGSVAARTLVASRDVLNDVRPASPYAQVELGLRLHYQDNVTGKKYFLTIPAPDLSIVAQTGSDQIDLEEVTVAALVTAIEAVAVSPDGNPITIERGVIVGRNR